MLRKTKRKRHRQKVSGLFLVKRDNVANKKLAKTASARLVIQTLGRHAKPNDAPKVKTLGQTNYTSSNAFQTKFM